jgi:hypothetical protein
MRSPAAQAITSHHKFLLLYRENAQKSIGKSVFAGIKLSKVTKRMAGPGSGKKKAAQDSLRRKIYGITLRRSLRPR